MFFSSFFFMNLYVSSAKADEEKSNIPTPIFLHTHSSKEQKSMTIERIAGCYGDIDEARNHIRSPKGILQESIFQYNSYTRGVFDITEPSCILDDSPNGVQPLNMITMNFEDYLYTEFGCGCGECAIDENTFFEENEVLAHATEEHKKSYAKYKEQRDKVVAKGKVIYEEYKKDHKRWSDIREKNLKNESIRITITPSQDMPEGTLTVYNFHWQVYSWCGDPHQVNRVDIQSKGFQHPAVKKGEQLTVWLDNANTAISWGAVFHGKELSSEDVTKQIEGEAQYRYQENLPPFDGFPEKLKGTMTETEPGQAANTLDECCAC